MGRIAKIIDLIQDKWGDYWDVREYRPTGVPGLKIALGWPHGQPRGARMVGGPRVVITEALADIMEQYRDNPGDLVLPIGNSAIRRVRSILGHHRYFDSTAWWEDRIDDLSTLSAADFARLYGQDPHTVSVARIRFCGTKNRQAGWWRAPGMGAVLNLPITVAAETLGLSAGSVRRLRKKLEDDSTICRATGCTRPAHARGLCTAHYQQELRYRKLATPRAKELLNQKIQISMTTRQLARLEAHAQAKGISVAGLVRELLAEVIGYE